MNKFESSSLQIDCAGETLLLHPERVIFWPGEQTVFAADVHVGKEHSFGRNGVAVPGGISEDTLQRLFRLCDEAGARHLCVLGDFMHTTPRHDEQWLKLLSELLDERPRLSMSIIAGNHDKVTGQLMIDRRVIWRTGSVLQSPFILRHEPGDDARGFVLSGHLHPAWRLGHARRSSLRTPIFWFRRNHAVLPAFGNFTGGVVVAPDKQHDKIFMAGPDGVVEVPVSARKTRAKTGIPNIR